MSSVKDHSVGALQKAELRNERSLVAEVWWRTGVAKTDILRWAIRTKR